MSWVVFALLSAAAAAATATLAKARVEGVPAPLATALRTDTLRAVVDELQRSSPRQDGEWRHRPAND